MAAITVNTYATGHGSANQGYPLSVRRNVAVWNNGSATVWWTRTSDADPADEGVALAPDTGFEFADINGTVYLAAEADGQDVRVEEI